jgi:hypothetical protein
MIAGGTAVDSVLTVISAAITKLKLTAIAFANTTLTLTLTLDNRHSSDSQH